MGRKPDISTTKAMYRLYNQGFSLAQVGRAFGVSRQSVFKRFVRRQLVLRRRPRPLPFVVFEGRKYTRRVVGYYGCTTGSRDYLHRDVWRAQHGPIPKGKDVHHIDRNPANNHISNLALMSKAEHTRRFSTGENQHTKRRK